MSSPKKRKGRPEIRARVCPILAQWVKDNGGSEFVRSVMEKEFQEQWGQLATTKQEGKKDEH